MTRAEREVGDRIRALLRERDYTSAAAYARSVVDSLGIQLPPELRTGSQTAHVSDGSGESPDTRPAGDPVATEPAEGTEGTSETVSSRMASIFHPEAREEVEDMTYGVPSGVREGATAASDRAFEFGGGLHHGPEHGSSSPPIGGKER